MPDLHDYLRYASSSRPPSLSPAQEKLLQQLDIEEMKPGTILRDFQVLLDFIGPEGIEVSPAQKVLSVRALEKINRLLSHPIEIQLRRPEFKSYPHIKGLYMLLRSSGMSYIETQGNKHFLRFDTDVLESWNSLNPTERYFNLLEMWLLWGSDETSGDRQTVSDHFRQCLMFWRMTPSTGRTFANYIEQQSLIYSPGMHNVALLELFGCIEVQNGRPEPRKGWRIKKLKRLSWGNILLLFLYRLMYEANEEDKQKYRGRLGVWQSSFQPFFSQWQRNLEIATQEKFRQGLHIFKVSFASLANNVWRRLAIPADRDLLSLSSAILESVNFEDDELHCFIWTDRLGKTVKVNHPYLQEPPFTTEFAIGDLPLKEGQSMSYLFDFEKAWEFKVELERIESTDSSTEPRILESSGEAPAQYD